MMAVRATADRRCTEDWGAVNRHDESVGDGCLWFNVYGTPDEPNVPLVMPKQTWSYIACVVDRAGAPHAFFYFWPG